MGRIGFYVLCELLETLCARGDEIRVVELFFDHHVQQPVEQRHVRTGAELHEHVGMVDQVDSPRVDDGQRRARACGLLDEGGGHGVVFRGVGPRHEDEIRLEGVGEGIAHGARADGLEQGGHRTRVAEPRAVIHVVRAEHGADEFLEEVVVLVRAFGRAETGHARGAVRIKDFPQRIRRQVQGLFPARLAEQGEGISGQFLRLGRAFLSDEGGREAIRVMRVVESVAPLHAESSPVHGTRLVASDAQEGVAGHLVGDGTSHAAVGADGIHLFGLGGTICSVRDLFVSASVGQAAMHSPHETQVDSPMGRSESNTILALEPLPPRPMTLLP